MARTPLITKDQLERALEATDWDFQRAAIALDVHLTTVYRTARRHGIPFKRPAQAAA